MPDPVYPDDFEGHWMFNIGDNLQNLMVNCAAYPDHRFCQEGYKGPTGVIRDPMPEPIRDVKYPDNFEGHWMFNIGDNL